VEGSAKTFFEGPISTEGETFQTPTGEASHEGPHPCNYSGNGNFEGFPIGGTPTGTPTTALRDAALSVGLPFDAKWSPSIGDFFVTQVGTDLNQTKEPFASWGYAVNDTTAPVGGCQIALAPGSEVLWAYNYFNLKYLLKLSGPSSVTVGTPFTVHVADGQTGEPVSGAMIGQLVSGVTSTANASPTTDSAGNATVTLTQVGTVTLKATQSESVRSNGLTVSVGYGAACACAPLVPVRPAPTPVPLDVAKIAGVENGHVYSRRSAPRLLGGMVEVPVGGTLRQVRIRLERRYHGHCWDFSGSRVKFIRAKKCGTASFFSVGGSESFSYLLPAGLPAGHYTYEIEAVDGAGHATKLVSGVSHVVFTVK